MRVDLSRCGDGRGTDRDHAVREQIRVADAADVHQLGEDPATFCQRRLNLERFSSGEN
jgi:hypothetical protein